MGLDGLPVQQGASQTSVVVADASEVLQGFVNGGGLVAVPILGAFALASAIAAIIVYASVPSVSDEEED